LKSRGRCDRLTAPQSQANLFEQNSPESDFIIEFRRKRGAEWAGLSGNQSTKQGVWFMKRICPTLTALVLLIPAVANADTVDVIDASGRGSIDSIAGANGNTSTNGYVAGYPDGFAGSPPGQDRDHFDFSIPSLGGDTLTSATLTLSNPNPVTIDFVSYFGGHGGGTNTFSVSGLGSFGTYTFSQIGLGTAYGSTDISGNGTVTINLNAAALAAITADQGSTFSLGGVDSGENTPFAYDFFATRLIPGNPNTYTTALTLDYGPAAPPPPGNGPKSAPEPASITLLVSGFFAAGGFGLYRRRRGAAGSSTAC
jgi:hypothetical protein